MTLPHDNDEHITKSATDARQGVTGHNVRYVLAASLAAVIAAFAMVAGYFHWFA